MLIQKKIDFEAAKNYWAYQPITKPAPPKTQATTWPTTDIDKFLLAKMEAAGIKPAQDADPKTLIRRVYFDVVGLPPTPEQVEEYVNTPTPEKLAEIVDRLLATPQFGERWGRHWLDVVRYGESTGMERNYTYPHAWRYRDYVIKAINEDKPFDRFLTEQIAGDLLEAKTPEERQELLVATGMLAMGPKSLNERNREQFAMDIVDDQIDVTTRGFLGLTVVLCPLPRSQIRCHPDERILRPGRHLPQHGHLLRNRRRARQPAEWPNPGLCQWRSQSFQPGGRCLRQEEPEE